MRIQRSGWTVAAVSTLALLAAGSGASGLGWASRESSASSLRPAGGPRSAQLQVAPPRALDALSRQGFGAYASGTVYHTDPELSGESDDGAPVNADIDLAMSDAAHASEPLGAVHDELGREVAPPLAAGRSFSRGHAVGLPGEFESVDLGDFDPAPAEASAPPTGRPVRKETSVDLSMLAADSFGAEASARAQPAACVIGDDLARGWSQANDTSTRQGPVEPDVSLNDEVPPQARA
jgi:hypothetical protein